MTKMYKCPEGLVERSGFYHVNTTVHANGKSKRIRETTKVAVGSKANRDAAKRERDRIIDEHRHVLIHGVKPTVSFAYVADLYIAENTDEEDSLADTQLRNLRRFNDWAGEVAVRDVDAPMLTRFIAQTMKRRKTTTRKRNVGPVLTVLKFAKERGFIDEVPTINFSKKTETSSTVPSRPIKDMSSDLIARMIDHAPTHVQAQLAVQWCTGARVSSVLHGCKISDLDLSTPGSETITFHNTKNGDNVEAFLHPYAVGKLRVYLQTRDDLQSRDAPLFLTDRQRPYKEGRGAQNRRAIDAMKRRTVRTLRREAAETAADLRAQGQFDKARQKWAEAQYEASLVKQFAQHDLRRWFATHALQHMSIDEVRRQGGWRSMAALKRYPVGAAKNRHAGVQKLAVGPSSNTGRTKSTPNRPSTSHRQPSGSQNGTHVAQGPRRRPKNRWNIWI